MRSIVITGTSSGIGYAAAQRAIAEGARVFGSVRRPEDAQRLQGEFGSRFEPLLFDVRDEPAIARAAATVRRALYGRTLSGLVNNAGIGTPGPLLFQPSDEVREQIEVNLLSLFWVTKAFGPLLGADRSLTGPPGRVVNMSSIGGKVAQPFATGYSASKHAVEGFSEALRRELALYDIKVIIMAPALVATPIWDKLKAHRGKYRDTEYADAYARGIDMMIENGKTQGLSPEAVADDIWHALTAAEPFLRYAPATHPLIEQWAARGLPVRVLDWAMEWFLGLRPSDARPRRE